MNFYRPTLLSLALAPCSLCLTHCSTSLSFVLTFSSFHLRSSSLSTIFLLPYPWFLLFILRSHLCDSLVTLLTFTLFWFQCPYYFAFQECFSNVIRFLTIFLILEEQYSKEYSLIQFIFWSSWLFRYKTLRLVLNCLSFSKVLLCTHHYMGLRLRCCPLKGK